MKADPELYALATTPEWPMWMGDSCSVLGTFVTLRAKHALTLTLSSPRLSNGVFPCFIWLSSGFLSYCDQHKGKEYAVHVFWPDSKLRPGDVEEGWDVVESLASYTLSPCEPR